MSSEIIKHKMIMLSRKFLGLDWKRSADISAESIEIFEEGSFHDNTVKISFRELEKIYFEALEIRKIEK